jgi:predicted ATPase/DNA-binding SARP family transcriptional activator
VGEERAAALDFRVLGSMEVAHDGSLLTLGGRRQRALLALLLLEPGRPVSADGLIDELWRGEAPSGAATTLRSYVSRLRTVLGDAAPITGGSSGYALQVLPERIDATRFERLVRQGQEARARGAPRTAAERLREALTLWRGRPFAGLADEGALRAAAERLDELRLHALEERLAADLTLGRSAELVEELEALVAAHPYRERLWNALMLALYRAGRQADALSAYARARRLLDDLGLEPGLELRELERAILRHEVPAATVEEERHHLPVPVTSFVGREPELAELAQLLAEARLVTLTGIGGAGKTRLALEATARALPELPGDVVFVDLAPLDEPEHVPRHVALAVGLRERHDAPVVEQLAEHVRDRELLLLLDNCEHLREACATLVDGLLPAAPRLRLLATSREPLRVQGEVDFAVPPLAVPRPAATEDELRESESVRLFLARARAVRPRLPDNRAALETAARICRDLDGLPFAIELAAARAKALSLDEIAGRLDDRFRFLASWRRLAPARHRTLEEAMDWSYDLLEPDERTLLDSFSVFSGGFTLEAAAAVCLDGAQDRALELVGRLVDASLITPDEHEGRTRYRLLETVRQYTARRLEARGAEAELRQRHAEWCVALAEEAEPQLTGERQAWWFEALEAEHDNLRAAAGHLASSGQGELRLRLVVPLSRYWYVRGHLAEARGWLEPALQHDGDEPADVRRRALTAAAAVTLLQGDYEASTRYSEEALEAARRTGERLYVANALSNLGAIVLAAGDRGRAGAVLEEAVELAREVGDQRIAALAINNLGDLALTNGDYERARPLFEESLALLRARGDTSNIARALYNLGAVDLVLGRHGQARERFSESVQLSRTTGDKEDLAWCLEGFAALAAAAGEGERASLLLGAAGALLAQMGAEFKPFERQLHDATEAKARGLCGDLFEAAAERGAVLTLEEALELSLMRAAT